MRARLLVNVPRADIVTDRSGSRAAVRANPAAGGQFETFELPRLKDKSRRSRLKVGYVNTNLEPENGRPR